MSSMTMRYDQAPYRQLLPELEPQFIELRRRQLQSDPEARAWGGLRQEAQFDVAALMRRAS